MIVFSQLNELNEIRNKLIDMSIFTPIDEMDCDFCLDLSSVIKIISELTIKYHPENRRNWCIDDNDTPKDKEASESA